MRTVNRIVIYNQKKLMFQIEEAIIPNVCVRTPSRNFKQGVRFYSTSSRGLNNPSNDEINHIFSIPK